MSENKIDIKNHPIVVIALAVAGSFGFYHQVILPIMTAKMQTDIEKIPGYEKKIDDLTSELEKTKTELQILQQSNLFLKDSSYPRGFGRVQIGDSIEKLLTLTINNNIEKKESMWILKNYHPIFKEVVYYFNEDSPLHEITHIYFNYMGSDYNFKAILEDTFGEPKHYKKKNCFTWDIGDKRIYKSDDFSYIVMKKEFHPGYWPEE